MYVVQIKVIFPSLFHFKFGIMIVIFIMKTDFSTSMPILTFLRKKSTRIDLFRADWQVLTAEASQLL